MDKIKKLSDHQLSILIINIFMDTGKPFTAEQVCQVILFYDGILRVSICYPITEYLNDLVKENILSCSTGWYQAGERLLSLKGFPPKVAA